MKIGMFLAYPPLTTLTSEGLGRYIGNLLKGFVADGQEVTIACPKWALEPVRELLDSFMIPEESLTFMVMRRTPSLYALGEKLLLREKKKVKKSRKAFLARTTVKFTERIMDFLFSFSNTVLVALVVLTIILVGILLLPMALLVGILLGILWLISKFHTKGRRLFSRMLRFINTAFESFSDKRLPLFGSIYEMASQKARKRMIHMVNKNDARDIWFIPTMFWPEISGIRGSKAVVAPDLVTYPFAVNFGMSGDNFMPNKVKACLDVLEGESNFITYCDYVRRELPIKLFAKEPEDVVAIPHSNNDMLDYIHANTSEAKIRQDSRDMDMVIARHLINGLLKGRHSMGSYGEDFCFDGMRYIFYPTQARPHKNLINLIKAYEYLLRKKFIPIKLILTCDLKTLPDLDKYVQENGLGKEVLSFMGVSAQELAALYKCADLVVNSTLYEGGFLSFTFGEGMSVGTPSLMGRIPQVTEVTCNYDVDEALFNPHDWMSIAKSVEAWLNRKEELCKVEQPMYKDLEKRTAKAVAREYIQTFEYFIDRDKAKAVDATRD